VRLWVSPVGHVHHTVDQAQLVRLLRSPDGAVARDILSRSLRVANAAKRNLGSSPRRVNTGRLRSSITWQLVLRGNRPVGRIGTNVRYAPLVHSGTGIYGPRGTPIVPKRAQVLRWKSSGKFVFSARSRGMRPNPFLKSALRAAVR
jgi:hypothetical protein